MTDNAQGYPAYRCSFCHAEGDWYLTRIGDAVVEWLARWTSLRCPCCDDHLVWTLDKLQRREPGSTEITEAGVQ